MLESARSVSDLESATQKPRDEVEKWLSGAVSPHLGELRRLGKLLGRSPFFFMLPEPPSSTPTAVEFRRALRKDINEDERAVELQALRWGRRTQSVARDLLNSADLLGNATTWAEDIELDDQASPARAAEQVRVWLAWDTATQVNATSKSAAFKSLRAAVEERGVLVALRSAGTSRFCGFSLPDPVAPLIYVNKDYELGSVRSFTLMHELGHVLRGNRRVCYGGDKGVEQWCNRFAAAFLMPRQHLLRYWTSQSLSITSPQDTDAVRRVANRYKTSWHASAVRLEQLGLAPSGTGDYVKKNRPESPEGGFAPGGGRTVPTIRLDEYGYAFARLVADAAEQGTLASLDARRLLNVNGPELAEVAALARGRDR